MRGKPNLLNSLKHGGLAGSVSYTLLSHVLICQTSSHDFQWTSCACSSLKGLLLVPFFLSFLSSQLLGLFFFLLSTQFPTGLVPVLKQLYTWFASAACSLAFLTPQVPCGAQQIWKSSSVRWKPRAMFPWISTIITFLNLPSFAFKSVRYILHF